MADDTDVNGLIVLMTAIGLAVRNLDSQRPNEQLADTFLASVQKQLEHLTLYLGQQEPPRTLPEEDVKLIQVLLDQLKSQFGNT